MKQKDHDNYLHPWPLSQRESEQTPALFGVTRINGQDVAL